VESPQLQILACTRRALNAEDLYPCLGQSYRVVTTLKVGAAKLSHAQGSFLGRQVQVNHSITHKLQIVVRSLVAAFGSEKHRSALFAQKGKTALVYNGRCQWIGSETESWRLERAAVV